MFSFNIKQIVNTFDKVILSKSEVIHELIVFKDGAPDFYELLRRATMSDVFKIQLIGSKLPCSV
jgi:bifunctional non-homologous end joining protein LigD